MKSKTLLNFIAFLLCYQVYAQNNNWTRILPYPNGIQTNDVLFFNSKKGIIISDLGEVLRTTDGTTWKFIESYTYLYLRSITYIDSLHPIIVGDSGLIMTSSDEGDTWTKKIIDPNYNHKKIKFYGADTGMIVGSNGYILRTINGGATWNKITISDTNNLNSVVFVNKNLAYIVGENGTLLKSNDAGITWNNITSPTLGWADMKDIVFVDSTTGYIARHGISGFNNDHILITNDGGLTWNPVIWQLSIGGAEMDCITARNNKQILAGNISGPNIARYNYSSGKWERLNVGVSTTAICFRDSLNVYTSGSSHKNSYDGGKTWYTNTNKELINNIETIYALNDSTIFISGDKNRIYKTTNRFKTFKYVTTPECCVSKIQFVNDSIAFAHISGHYSILRTTDTGNTWNYIYDWAGSNMIAIEEPFFYSPSSGYALASNHLYKTTDSGATWNKITTINDSMSIFKLSVVDSSNIYVAINGGTDNYYFLYSNDGGTTWQLKPPITPYWLVYEMYFVSATTGFIHDGLNSQLYKTTDGAQTWQSVWEYDINPNPVYIFTKFLFIDSLVGMAAGRRHSSTRTVFYYTVDGGYTWKEDRLRSDCLPKSLYITKDKECFIGGSDFQLHTKNLTQDIILETPHTFKNKLTNNINIGTLSIFPNPFNSHINISTSTPNETLAIYDFLGNIVFKIKLTNSNRIDLSSLSSGVYFVKISNNESLKIDVIKLIKID